MPADEAPSGHCIRPSGRDGHTREYLEATLSAAGFRDLAIQEVDLRREAGEWVPGYLVSARVERR